VPPANVSIWLVTRNPSVTHVIFATFINSIIPTSSNPLPNLPEFEGERQRERKKERILLLLLLQFWKVFSVVPIFDIFRFLKQEFHPLVCVGGSLSLM
jgi:hypothetical protein